jgi:cytochrome c-type biogenesis protein
MIAFGGQYVVGHVRGITRYTQQIQQGFGVVVILVSAALYLQYDVLINAWLLDFAPNLTIGI